MNRGSRLRLLLFVLYVAVMFTLLSFFLGSLVTRAAPRGAHVIPAGDTAAVPAAVTETAQPDLGLPGASPVIPPIGDAPAPVSGVASWYAADGLVAAAGPRLRTGAWRGRLVEVRAGGQSVRVRLTDWCQCYGTRLLDLSDDAFARLAPLSRGLVRVQIAGVGPVPTLPPTDRSTP